MQPQITGESCTAAEQPENIPISSAKHLGNGINKQRVCTNCLPVGGPWSTLSAPSHCNRTKTKDTKDKDSSGVCYIAPVNWRATDCGWGVTVVGRRPVRSLNTVLNETKKTTNDLGIVKEVCQPCFRHPWCRRPMWCFLQDITRTGVVP